jgi:hypothetical protein
MRYDATVWYCTIGSIVYYYLYANDRLMDADWNVCVPKLKRADVRCGMRMTNLTMAGLQSSFPTIHSCDVSVSEDLVRGWDLEGTFGYIRHK